MRMQRIENLHTIGLMHHGNGAKFAEGALAHHQPLAV
jgi:hypothetical protein